MEIWRELTQSLFGQMSPFVAPTLYEIHCQWVQEFPAAAIWCQEHIERESLMTDERFAEILSRPSADWKRRPPWYVLTPRHLYKMPQV